VAKGRVKGLESRPYRVFVSHSGDDIWVARQLARCIEDQGATAFLDRRDILAGDKFKDRIHTEISACDELLALITPWSRLRAWIRHEIGMADYARKRIVCVFYQVSVVDFRADADGLGPLDGLNIIDINALDTYFSELQRRVRSRNG
jgi:TIR domain-containing protein